MKYAKLEKQICKIHVLYVVDLHFLTLVYCREGQVQSCDAKRNR